MDSKVSLFNFIKDCFNYKAVFIFLFLLSININGKNIITNFSGIVLDSKTGDPIPNAVIQILEKEKYTTTTNEGRFRFENLEEEPYKFKVTHISYQENIVEFDLYENLDKNIIIYLIPKAIEIGQVIITDRLSRSKFDEIHEERDVLKGKELERDLGLTLAATLKNETGLSMRSMGPAPARPVFRGLGSDRITISEDDITTIDLSAASPDHSVTVEPFTADRIEVIRGPKILLQNSTTIGGIINLVRDEIPIAIPDKIHGSIGFYGESVNLGYLGALVAQIPLEPFSFRLEGSSRKASDLKTPSGTLNNTSLLSNNFSGGVSIVEKWGFFGASFRVFDSEYGIPGGFVGAHPNGVNIEILKRNFNSKLLINFKHPNFLSLESSFSRSYYRQTEFESNGLVGAEFYKLTYLGYLNFNTKDISIFKKGTIGLSFKHRDFKIGGFVFTPFTKALELSAYFYQNFKAGKFNFEFAGRYTYENMDPKKALPSTRDDFIVNKTFNNFSLSFSLLYGLTENLYAGGYISRSSRVPTIEELYSEGPHLAAYSYEIGNPNLPAEKGFGGELFFYYKIPDLFFNLTFFRNDLSTFIIPRNTGEINFATLLPIYSTQGVHAVFYGVESQIDWKTYKNFSISSNISYTHGKIKNTDSPLPSIPPLKSLTEIKYSSGNLLVGLGIEAAAEQKRVDEFEEPTSGYAIFNSFAQYSLLTGELVHNFSVNAENLLNKEYRNHLSRVKSILPEAGRNFRITYKLYF